MNASFPLTVKRWLDASIGFLYPEICQVCNEERATASEGFVCGLCWQNVRFLVPPCCDRCGLPFEGEITTAFECENCREMELHFRAARSAVSATGMVREVILRYKYQRALWFEPFLAGLLIQQAAPVLAREKCDLIVPVPLHFAKRREREFNQAERLAACLGRATQIPMNTKLLRRVEPTRTQTLLSRSERAANVRKAFALQADAMNLKGRKIVLVDDVFTTGATTSACARVLLSAGADDVCVWTVARGL